MRIAALIKSYCRKVRKYSVYDGLLLTLSYIKGVCISLIFKKRALISVVGALRIYKKNGEIIVGNYVRFWPNVKLSCGGEQEKAILVIGDRTSIGDRTEIHASREVRIGTDVMISWDCVILDDDYHGVGEAQKCVRPIVIEDNVWIGCRSIILKGVHLGKNAVIGAGSVVTKDVLPYTLVAGNPAKVIRTLDGTTTK